MEDYNIYCGDCLNYMKKIPSESIDLIVTDPPYLMDFQSGYRKRKYNKIKNDTVQNEKLISEYFEHSYRILKNDTAIYCFCSWHHIDIFKQEFEKYFKLKNIIIWQKNNTSMGDLKGSYAPKYEMVLFGHKGRRLLNGFRYPDILEFKRTNNKLHPTEKPVDLLELFIKQSSDINDVVFDGFMGSGSTGVACLNTNRKFIGCELDENYFKIAEQRLKNTIKNI